jgi:hypothetical protein
MDKFTIPQGKNFRCKENIPINELTSCLCKIASFLQAEKPYISLLRYDDWWQHDGLHFFREKIDFHGLFEMVKSPKAIMESMPGDDYVRVGISASDFIWYLRFYADWDESGSFLEGNFDITLPYNLTEKFNKEIISNLSISIIEEESKSYYRRIQLR